MRVSATPSVHAYGRPLARSAPLATWARFGGLAALAFAVAVVGWWRLGPVARDTLWAEDGETFLTGALQRVSVLQPYAGYLHVVPRLVADIVVATVPTTYWAVAVSAASCLVVGLIGVLVYVCSGGIDLSRPARVGLALLTVVAPASAHEGLGNLANLHWFFLWAAPWLFLARPRRWGSGLLLGVVALLLTMSEIQMVLFSPLLVVRLWDDRRWPMVGGVVGGLAAQILTTLTSPRTLVTQHPTWTSVAHGYALQVGGGAWVSPLDPVLALVVTHGWWITYLALVPVLVAAAIWTRTAVRERWLAAVLLVSSFVVWSTGFWLGAGSSSSWATYRPDQLLRLPSSRYAIVPSLFLLGVLVLAVDHGVRAAGTLLARVARQALAVVGVAALVAAAGYSFDAQDTTRRSEGPDWRSSLPAATATCSRSSGHGAVTIPIAPNAWSVDLPCTLLPDAG